MFTLKLYQVFWRVFVPLFNSYKFEDSMLLPPWAFFSATLYEEEGFQKLNDRRESSRGEREAPSRCAVLCPPALPQKAVKTEPAHVPDDLKAEDPMNRDTQ